MKKLYKRLREPSTYASVAAVLALVGVKLDPGWIEAATQAGAGIAAVLGVLLAEKGEG